MGKHVYFLTLLTLTTCSLSEAQNATSLSEDNIRYETQYVVNGTVPNGITRTFTQDKQGNIWMAAFDGVFRYDARLPDGQGKSFKNITENVSSARFFSVLEDKKGVFWFGSVGSGVYRYDARLTAGAGSDRNDRVGQGKSLSAGQAGFQNFTSQQGLDSDNVTAIYEDKNGNIWFGATRYDGKSFRKYRMNEVLKTTDDKNDNDVNAIVEDKTGKIWFGTRGRLSIYDGNKYTVPTYEGQAFWNIRSLIEDKAGNIWLGGEQGLWRFDGTGFAKISQNSVGHISEDKHGNLWASAQVVNSHGYARDWALLRYDQKSLADAKPVATEIRSDAENGKNGMIFGILAADDGSVWFGALDGVYRYENNTITGFKSKEVK